MHQQAVLEEYEKLGAVIRAAEDWSKLYDKDMESKAKLIKAEAKLERSLVVYFKEFSDRVSNYINWFYYINRRPVIQADDLEFDIDVLINDEIGNEDGILINTMYDPITDAVAAGAQAGEQIYGQPVGLTKTSSTVQNVARNQVAKLVGKSVTQDGRFIDNPKAEYSITNKTRDDIRQSLRTSLGLGEDQAAAVARLRETIKNPRRAEIIARTEAVNAYGGGLLEMGRQSGAVAKEWQALNANDICAVNENAGMIPITDEFPSGHQAPSAHPNCRCGLRLVYEEEYRRAHPFKSMGQEGFIELGAPANDAIANGRKYRAVGKSSEPFTVYHGVGNNTESPYTDILGNSFYVARDKKLAAEFGKTSKLKLPFGEKDILLINDDEHYSQLIGDSIRFAVATKADPNTTFAIPNYINHLGYKAAEIPASVDPMAGIAVTNPESIAAIVKQLSK